MTAEARKEHTEAIVDKGALVQKRLYISGLKEDVAVEELGARFKSFGKVLSVDLAGGGPTGGCRGFGYVSIEATPASIGKCLSLYNGSKWKGMQLHIEEAKQGYMTKLKREWAQIAAHEDALQKSEGKPAPISNKKRKKRAVDLAPDMSLVTDRNAKNRKHWRLSRFGRAVTVFRYRDPATGRMVTVDPLRYKDNITRPESYAKFTPVSKLLWPSDDIIAPKPRWQLLLEQAAAEEAEAIAAKAAREGGIFAESDNDEEPAQYPALDVTALYEDERDTETESEDDDEGGAGGLFDEMDVDEPAPAAPISKHIRLEYDEEPLATDADDDFEVVPSSAPRLFMPAGFSDDSDDEVPSSLPPPRHTERDPSLKKERSHLLGLVQSILRDQSEDSTTGATETADSSDTIPKLTETTDKSAGANAIPAPNQETAELLKHMDTPVEDKSKTEGLSIRAIANSQGSEGTDHSSLDGAHNESGSDSDSEFDDEELSAGSDNGSEEEFDDERDEEADARDKFYEEVRTKLEAVADSRAASQGDEEDDSSNTNLDGSSPALPPGRRPSVASPGAQARAQAMVAKILKDRNAAIAEDIEENDATVEDNMEGISTEHTAQSPLPTGFSAEFKFPTSDSLDVDVESSTSAAEAVATEKASPAKLAKPVSLAGDRHYAVNTNLRALLFADVADEDTAPGFSLFGQPAESGAAPVGVDLFARPSTSEAAFELFPTTSGAGPALQEQPSQTFDATAVARSFGSSQLFFLHIGDRSLAHRSIYAPNGTFRRTDTEEEIKMQWEDSRQELTQDFKSKHKMASRKKDKMKRPRKSRPS
ncbi:nucleolar protein 8 [Geranomyces variabilis]|uniref:Nucleolar protein 8 n=1 Tax=Geranomyces variabilis TaxID=109894 RepID=A0AAD5TQF2_9FUNG|nr:nucleolar protein 8 [Geranomyces variabilis]